MSSEEDDYFQFFFPNEEARIKKFSTYVKREGDTLYFKLRTGSYATLTDFEGCEAQQYECESYRFLNYYRDEELYLVFVKQYEGFDYVMVAGGTGETHRIHTFPGFSPDRKRLITTPGDETGYGKNGVFIWRVEDGGLVSELAYELYEYAMYGVESWEDDGTIVLSKHVRAYKEFCPQSIFMTVPVTLRLEKGGWKYYEDLSVDTVKCIQ
ncbi:MAG: hypothetical protein V3W31_07410 [Thermodesulfobacteriota bacterium]